MDRFLSYDVAFRSVIVRYLHIIIMIIHCCGILNTVKIQTLLFEILANSN